MLLKILAGTSTIPIDQLDELKDQTIEEAYPLSPMQQGMLFHSLYTRKSGIDIEQVICDLHEKIEASAFEQAWQRVVQRHPALRTSFRWEQLDEPLQQVHRCISISLDQQDWRGLSATEQEEQLAAFLQTDRQAGFDPTKPPLLRLSLFQLAEADYRFIWTYHHILLDGRSLRVIINEVFAFYEAFCRGEDFELERPRPYKDHIEWLQQQPFDLAEPFWRQLLTGFAAATPLVAASASDDLLYQKEGYRRSQEVHLSLAVTFALRFLGKKYGLTLNTVVQGAWALLLSRYSGEKDVVFGATRACRRSSPTEADTVIGLFINTLPVRVRVSSEMILSEWLKNIRAQQIALREWEHTPLVKIQGWSDVPHGLPLFKSILVFENYLLNSSLQAQGGDWKNREFLLHQRTNYPITVLVYGEPELVIKIVYDTPYLDNSAVLRMLGHMEVLLNAMAANPDQQIGDVPLLNAAERQQLLVDFNDTSGDDPIFESTIQQLFEAQVKRTPEAIAVVYEEQQVSYGELNRRANRVAHYLQQQGVGAEAVVGILLERSLEMVVSLLAVLKAGAAYVPLDPDYPAERLSFMLEDVQVRVLLTEQRLVERLGGTETGLVCIDIGDEEISGERVENPVSKTGADNLAYVIYTSGSTGVPKGVMITHHSATVFLRWAHATFSAHDLSGMLASTSICFDLSVFELFAPLTAGGLVVLAQNALQLAQLAAKEEVHLINTVPSAMTELLRLRAVPPQVRSINLAGEELSRQLVEHLYSLAQVEQVYNLYGPSEDTTYSTYLKVARGGAGAVTIGAPVGGTHVHILDEQLRLVPIGVSGELYVGGEGLARGYWQQPELTADKFVPHPYSERAGSRLYRTGDIGRYRADGEIEFLGRRDQQVKVRGFRIELGEIEAVLGGYPGIREQVVIVREDQPGDKRLVAYLVSEAEGQPSVSELRQYLQGKLPDYMVPAAFVQLEALPLTPNGKVDRKALSAPEQYQAQTSASYVAPRNSTEITVAGIWSEVLKVEPIGVHENFFDLGGHSLLATRVISKLRRSFQLEIPLRSLFAGPTIATLSDSITEAQSLGSLSRPAAISRLSREQYVSSHSSRAALAGPDLPALD